MNNNTMTKDEYFAALREWKNGYRVLSRSQRRLKHYVRLAQCDGGGPPVGMLSLALVRGAEQARLMLEQRASLKLVARQAYLLAHPSPSA